MWFFFSKQKLQDLQKVQDDPLKITTHQVQDRLRSTHQNRNLKANISLSDRRFLSKIHSVNLYLDRGPTISHRISARIPSSISSILFWFAYCFMLLFKILQNWILLKKRVSFSWYTWTWVIHSIRILPWWDLSIFSLVKILISEFFLWFWHNPNQFTETVDWVILSDLI